MIFVSTINRNLKSFILAKIMAEYILNYVPKGTHQYEKFITPYELTSLLEGHNFKVENIDGLSFNPLEESFSITKNTNINYFSSLWGIHVKVYTKRCIRLCANSVDPRCHLIRAHHRPCQKSEPACTAGCRDKIRVGNPAHRGLDHGVTAAE